MAIKKIIFSLLIGVLGVLLFLYLIKDAPIPTGYGFLLQLFFGLSVITFLLISLIQFLR